MTTGTNVTIDAIVHALDDPGLRAQCQRDLMLTPLQNLPHVAERWAGVGADLAAAKARGAEIAAHLAAQGALPDDVADATDLLSADADQARRLGRGAA